MDSSAIIEVLTKSLPHSELFLQVNQAGPQLTVIINRLPALTLTADDYDDMAELLMASLISLELPGIQNVKFYARAKGSGKPEWQITRTYNQAKASSSNPMQEVAADLIAMKDTTQKDIQNLVNSMPKLANRFESYRGIISTVSLVGIFLILLGNTFFALQPKSTVWEYKVESIEDASFTSSMNALGQFEWELVTARRAQNPITEKFGYECIFKRPRKSGAN